MHYGKRIELSIGESLKMAGVHIERSLSLDVNQKIDYLVRRLGRRAVPGGLGVQVSMQPDPVKMRVSKQLALPACRFFIYLLIRHPETFERPSRQVGESLKRLFENLLPHLNEHNALLLEVGNGVSVTNI